MNASARGGEYTSRSRTRRSIILGGSDTLVRRVQRMPPVLRRLTTHEQPPARAFFVAICLAGADDLPANSGGSHHATEERSEEHTSELQSQSNLVCRLL